MYIYKRLIDIYLTEGIDRFNFAIHKWFLLKDTSQWLKVFKRDIQEIKKVELILNNHDVWLKKHQLILLL